MTAPYVISREEHKELGRSYQPKSDWAAAVTGLIVGVPAYRMLQEPGGTTGSFASHCALHRLNSRLLLLVE